MKTEDIFIDNNSIAIHLLKKHEYPHMILPKLDEYIIKLGNSLGDEYKLLKENVWIHNTAKIDDSAKIIAPCIIDKFANISDIAYIECSIIGKNATIGHACEVKRSIIFDESTIAHFNHVGDSIIGHRSHLGAGAMISNVRLDKKTIYINYNGTKLNTNLNKVGAFVGDNVEIGCNSVLNPGTVIGPCTIIYPLTSIKGNISSNSVVKS